MPWKLKAICGILMTSLLLVQGNVPFVEVSRSDLHVNVFSSPTAQDYKTSVLHDDVLYIGGRGTLYRQDPENISNNFDQAIPWNALDSDRTRCRDLPQGSAETCYNFIRTIQAYNSTHMLLCGTMALRPKNMFLNIREGTLHEDSIIGTAMCSFDPMDNITSVAGNGTGLNSSIVATSRAQLQSQMTLVKNLPNSKTLRTPQGSGKMIDLNPNFVSSFSADDEMSDRTMKKLYFVFGENAREPGSNKIGSRIAQVCANDLGDQWNMKWTSFLKVPLLCQTNEDNPYEFDIVTHSTLSDDGILYGTFTTQSSTFRTSAVCAFRLTDIQRAFHSGKFWVEDKSTGQFSELPSQDVPVEPVSPGMCAYPGMGGVADATSHDFPPKFVDFMKTYCLVADGVKPINPKDLPTSGSKISGPLFALDKQIMTKIAIQSVTALNGEKYDVLFVATEKGSVVKFVSIDKNENIRLAQYNMANERISNMFVSSKLNQLYVETKSQVMQISTASCQSYVDSCEFCDPCRMCVLSRDPMCAWDNTKCVDIRSSPGHLSLVQDVIRGNGSLCGPIKSTQSTRKVPQVGTTVLLGIPVHSHSISAKWFLQRNGTTTPLAGVERYSLTADNRLEIASFALSDVGTYICEQSVGQSAVAKEIITISNDDDDDGGDGGSDGGDTDTGGTDTDTMSFGKEEGTTAAIDKSTDNTEPPTNGTGTEGSTPPLSLAMPVGGVVGIVFVAIILIVGILIYFVLCYRKNTYCGAREKEGKYSTGEKTNHRTNDEDTMDSVKFSNETNNSNKEMLSINSIDGGRRDKTSDETDRLITTIQPAFSSPQEHSLPLNRKVAKVNPYQNEQGNIEYIDEASNACTPSDDDQRERKPPQRTKSIPSQNLRVKLDSSRVVKCNSIHRHKARGTWFLEVDLPEDYVIEDGEAVDNLDFSNLGSDIFARVSDGESPHNHVDKTDDTGMFLPAVTDQRAGGDRGQMVKSALPDGDTDSDSTLKAFNSTIKLGIDSASSSLASTPRQYGASESISQPLLPSSYHSRSRAQNRTPSPKTSPRIELNLSPAQRWLNSCQEMSASGSGHTTQHQAHLRPEPARNDKSPTSTASSSSASSDRFHTAPPSPVKAEAVT